MESLPSTPLFEVPLAEPPRIFSGGLSVHGRRRVERYRFADLWCLHRYRYGFTLLLDGTPHAIQQGDVTLIPPGVLMEYRYPRSACTHCYVLFKLPAGEAGSARPSATRVHASARLPEGFAVAFDQMTQSHSVAPARAQCVLWDLLWRLCDAGRGGSEAPESRPRQAAVSVSRWVQGRLSQPLRVAELAREAGISHNQLTRQFRAEFGMTATAYIQQQRVRLAERLLTTTQMPIKAVANEVGLADVHQLNKTVRHHLGASPTQVRHRSTRPDR